MKRIISIFLVGVALFGCSEKKVTEDMLVGSWECTLIQQEADWKNVLFQDYSTPVNRGKSLVVYIKENDTLFVEMPDGETKMKLNFKKLNGNFSSILNDMKITGYNKLEYIRR